MSENESPFSEALRSEERPRRPENKPIKDLEFILDGDFVAYRKKFEDDSVSDWHMTNINPIDNPEMLEKAKAELFRKFGIKK